MCIFVLRLSIAQNVCKTSRGAVVRYAWECHMIDTIEINITKKVPLHKLFDPLLPLADIDPQLTAVPNQRIFLHHEQVASRRDFYKPLVHCL